MRFATELSLTVLIWLMRLPSNATFTHFYVKNRETVTEPFLTWKSSNCNWTTALPTVSTLKQLISWNNVTQLCRHEMQAVMSHSSLSFTYHGRQSHCNDIPLANSKMRWAKGDRQRFMLLHQFRLPLDNSIIKITINHLNLWWPHCLTIVKIIIIDYTNISCFKIEFT